MLPRIKWGYNERYLPVYWEDRYTHLSALGKSGTGKSSFLANCWQTDCLWRFAKILIEPSGFLARECYSISKGRAIYLSIDTPASINPLAQYGDPNQKVENVIEAINQVVKATSSNLELTTKMKGYLDEDIKACLNKNRLTLINVRDEIAKRRDDVTKDGLLARLNYLLSDERFTKILCGPHPIEWGQFIKERKTLIVDAFGMGRERMIFLGNLITQGIKNYFRYQRPKTYSPLALYIDECHNFLNPNMFDILKEGRKFKISCLMATQNFSTISPSLVREMMNVGTIVSFKAGHDVASKVAQEMAIPADVLQFLPKYHLAYLTPKEKGVAKAPRPPYAKSIEPSKPKPERKPKPSWFPLEPYEDVAAQAS